MSDTTPHQPTEPTEPAGTGVASPEHHTDTRSASRRLVDRLTVASAVALAVTAVVNLAVPGMSADVTDGRGEAADYFLFTAQAVLLGILIVAAAFRTVWVLRERKAVKATETDKAAATPTA